MIAVLELPDKLCVIRWAGRERFHMAVITLCGEKHEASGIAQVPDFVLEGRPVPSVDDFGGKGRRMLKICEGCKGVMAAAKG